MAIDWRGGARNERGDEAMVPGGPGSGGGLVPGAGLDGAMRMVIGNDAGDR